MKNSIKKYHLLQSVLVALCLLVSVLSFSNEKRIKNTSNSLNSKFIHSNSDNYFILNELAGPIITTQPSSQAICTGNPVTFSVVATGTGLSYSWKKSGITLVNGGKISGATTATLNLTNVTNSEAADYTCDITDTNGTTTSNPSTLTILPLPVLNSSLTVAVCSGTLFSYTGQGVDSSTSLSWSRASVSGISNTSATSTTGNISETLVNSTNAPIEVVYDYTLTLNGCTNTQSLRVTVNPKSQLTSSSTPTAICSGSTFSYTPTTNITGTTFSWSRASQVGITELSSSGTGSISEVLSNTTSAAIGVVYNYTLTTLSGCSSTGTITVNVSALPSSASSITGATSVCGGSQVSYTTTAITNATQYRWTLPDGSVTDTNSTTLTIDYGSMTSSGNLRVAGLNSCGVGVSSTALAITILPPPVLSSLLTATTCSGTLFSYTGQSSNSNTTISWLRRTVTGITPPASTIASTSAISETLVNSTNAPIEVVYDYTLTLNGCTNTQSLRVTVNPKSQLTSSSTPTAICSGSTFSYTPTTNITGTTFSWSRASQVGITELSSSGTGSISEVLSNTTSAAIGVVYNYTLTTLSGCSSTGTITVNVSALPSSASSITGATSVCGGSQVSYTTTAITNATQYRWTLPDGSVTDTNSTTLTIDYGSMTSSGNLRVAGLNSCGVGVSSTALAITILPPPVLNSLLTATTCSGSVFTYTASSSDSSTVLKWLRRAVTGITPVPSSTLSANGNINETLVNSTNAPIEVVYDYTLTLNGCTNTQSVTVKVNPNDILLNPPTAVEICSGVIFNFVPTTSINTTVFSWSRGTVIGTAPIISERLINNGNSSVNFTYNYNLTTAEGCVSQGNFTVKVNPSPKLINIPQTSFCTPLNAPQTFNYTPTANFTGVNISWSRAFNPEILEPASSGSGPISETLTSTSTTNTVYANYTFVLDDTVNGCDTTQGFSVTLEKMPDGKPVITGDQTVCAGSRNNVYTATTVTNAISYVWTLPNGSVVTTSSPGISLDFSLSATSGFLKVKGMNSCGDSTVSDNFSITVIAPPTLTSSLNSTICSGTEFRYDPISTDNSTTFSWTRAERAGISNTANFGSGSINETLINTTNVPVNVLYKYTILTSGGCQNIQYVTVTVNPTPNLNLPALNEVSCSGSLYTFTPTFNLSGSTYTWTRVPTAGITPFLPAGGGGSSAISETLTNTTASTIEVTYQITAVATTLNGGCSKTSELKVQVEPKPSAAGAITGPIIVCEGAVDQEYSVALIPNATSYQWTVPTGAVITSGLNSNVVKVNFGTATSATISVKGINLCGEGLVSVVPITVISLPTLTSTLNPAPICSGSEFTYTPISSDSSTTFTWTRAVKAGISNPASTGTGNIIETLINTTTSPIDVIYEYQLENRQGCISIKQVTVKVNPTPNLNLPALNEVTCSGSVYNYTPDFSLTGSTYTWTRVPMVGITPFLPVGGGGSSTISELLTNTTTATIEVTYQITAVATTLNGGCSKTSELKVRVEPSPSVAGAITGPITVCEGAVDQEYSVALIPNATSYQWTIPTGAVITSGLNSNVIKVSFSTAVSSTISVKGVNSCGGGVAFTMPINVYRNATISLVSGNPNTTLCIGSSFVTPIKYAIAPSSEVLSLTGVLPSGVTFTPSTGIITGTPTVSGSFPFTIASTSKCGSSLSGIIVVNPLQSITKLSGTANQIACINTPIDPIIYSIPTGINAVTINPALPLGIVYTVDVVNGLVSISGTPTVATSLAQNYIITTQGSCGPNSSTTISFDIKPAVILNFLSSTASLNQAVCLNGPIEPIRFSIGGGATGIIPPVLPTGLTFSLDSLTGIYTIQGNPTANGTFTIPITTTGCNKTEIITISNVNTAVSIDLLSALGTDHQTLCQSNFNSPIIPIQYTLVGATAVNVTGLPAGVSFVFDPTTSQLVISGTPIQTGIFNYTITSLPCSVIKTGVLKVSIPMFISSESVKNVSCNTASNGEIAVTIIGGVPLSGLYSVTWSGPNGFQQNQLNITGLQAGDYVLTGKDAIGCTIPTKTYTVLPALPITIALVSKTNVMCNNSLGCVNFNYTGGTGIFTHFNLEYLDSSLQSWNTVPNPTSNYFNICNLKAGLYRIAVTDSNNCTTEPYLFTIYDYGNLNIDAINLDDSLCANTLGKVRVTVTSLDPNLTFYYNNVIVPHTSVGNNVYELSISNPTTPTGIIKVVNQQNCWDTETVSTTLISPTQLNYTSVNLTTYGVISVNESVKFTNGLTTSNIPAEYDYIVWDFGDNSPFSVFHNPRDINLNSAGEGITTVFHTYALDGLYPVTLTVYNHFGCSRSISKIVTVGQGAKIMLPTAFSPNNDGINDLFRPSLLGLKEVSMYIYDNWGNLIYEVSSDATSLPTNWGWNGIEKVNSEPLNGTYRYYIMAKTINDTMIEKEGQFILIK